MQFVQDSLAEPMTCKYAQQKDPRYEKKHTDRTFQHSRCQNRYKDCSSVNCINTHKVRNFIERCHFLALLIKTNRIERAQ